MIFSRVRHELRGVKALRGSLRSGASQSGSVVSDVLQKQFELYRDFTVKRFDVYSRGGGDWKKLKPATERRKGNARILVDTKFLRLHLLAAIRVIHQTPTSVFISFQSDVTHPGAQMHLEELLKIHDQGLGVVPRRRMLVTPTEELKRAHSDAAKKVITDFLEKARA